MSFTDSAFDKSMLKFSTEGKRWISVTNESKVFPLLLAHIPKHFVHDDISAESYSVDVLPALSKEKDDKTSIITGRISLLAGYGQSTFKGLNGERYQAVYQRIGEPVGAKCGVAIAESIVVFTEGPIEQLAKFFSDLVELNEKTEVGQFPTLVWHIRHEYWKDEAKCTARPLTSVVLPSTIKNKLIKDMEKFLAPKTQSFYNANGIPYRRSYLFYGLPGTGKTSMVNALAGHFKRSVCYLMPTHPDMTDDSLRAAINDIPDNSIVVFEDIDSLFAKNRSNKVAKSALTFSGLLNALDGIGNTNGQVYVLTTNLREQLDPALIRNGRVDMHIEFTYAIEEQMQTMWRNFYPDSADLAEAFAATLTEKLTTADFKVTTAGLQHFFVTQMDSNAEEALANVDSIVADIQLTKVMEREEAELLAAEKLAEEKEATKGTAAAEGEVEVDTEWRGSSSSSCATGNCGM